MEKNGDLSRIRGGAMANPGAFARVSVLPEEPFSSRSGQSAESKRRIAEKAARFCADGETIIIDGGTTTYCMAAFLTDRRMTIITNSFAVTEVLVKKSRNTVILSGGIVYPESMILLDPFAEDFYANFSADKLFMGAAGIDEQGITNTDARLIRFERSMIERSREVYILADSSKFSRRGNLRLCGFGKITAVITDAAMREEHKQLLNLNHVRWYAV